MCRSCAVIYSAVSGWWRRNSSEYCVLSVTFSSKFSQVFWFWTYIFIKYILDNHFGRISVFLVFFAKMHFCFPVHRSTYLVDSNENLTPFVSSTIFHTILLAQIQIEKMTSSSNRFYIPFLVRQLDIHTKTTWAILFYL